MPALPIRDSAGFNSLISALATDVMNAKFHLDLLHAIWQAREEYEREFEQSPWFWHLTTAAHLETGLIKLARAYDTQDRGLHLSNWLETIDANLHIFSEEHFRARLKDNPFVDSLASTPRTPDSEKLAADIASVSTNDPDVKKLIFVRHNNHLSGNPVRRRTNGSAEPEHGNRCSTWSHHHQRLIATNPVGHHHLLDPDVVLSVLSHGICGPVNRLLQLGRTTEAMSDSIAKFLKFRVSVVMSER